MKKARQRYKQKWLHEVQVNKLRKKHDIYAQIHSLKHICTRAVILTLSTLHTRNKEETKQEVC